MAVYCAGCGQSLAADARFCSACGRPVVLVPLPSSRGPLLRPLAGRKIAGVCQGLANQYGWDVALTRVLAVLLTIALFPLGLLGYFVFWVIVPQEPKPASNNNLQIGPETAAVVTGLNPSR